MFDNLIRVNLNELRKLDSAYANREEFTEADSKKLDILTCTLSRLMKSLPYIEEYGYDQNVWIPENNIVSGICTCLYN